MIRPANPGDLDALVALENAAFVTDRISRRSFRHLLTRGHAATLVEIDEGTGEVAGYVTVLFNAGTSLARLYSIAVAERHRGRGVARRLAEAAEAEATARECVAMRLEIRRDNQPSVELFTSLGYRQFAIHRAYYEDAMEALRFEKRLLPQLRPDLVPVPFYPQSLDFTCGPAALLMAMKALAPEMAFDRRSEIRIWREATTVFMTSGHGGCGPYGLALSAHRRGFGVEIFVNDEGALFIDSVRSEEKKAVIELVQEDFREQVESAGIPVHYRRLGLDEMQRAFEQGAIPVVLISSWRIYREKFPHWVVVTGFDERFIYVHDPFVDTDKGKSGTDCMAMPIARREFARMARYGKSGLRAALLIRQRKEQAA